jgi:hypothetical protein
MRPGNALTWIFRGVGLLGVGLLAALSGCGGTTDDRPAMWSYIYPAIIEPGCATASCHSDVARRAGVNFVDSGEAYYQLVNRHFVVQCALPPAIPDPACLARAPNDSEVIHLMRAQGARRMPPDFALPEVDIQLIEQWIRTNATQD